MTGVTLDELGGWPGVLGTLTSRRDLDAEQAAAAMAEILDGNATSAQIAGFIVALRMKGETVVELTGLVSAMVDRSAPVVLARPEGVIDLVGTGGDRSHSINVSTLAALTVVGAGGRVCKHGNRAASSACGTADLLEALGVAFDLGPEGVARCVDAVDFGFCFAPRFHGAMRHAGPTRKELGVPTVFNFLGPLANPARVRRQVTGVADPAMAERMVQVLAANGAERALVVYGHDGLDELTITTTSTVHELRDGEVRSYEVDPKALGLAGGTLDDLRGGDADTNARLAHQVLGGQPGPQADIVALNAAAGLVAAGIVEDIASGVDAARASLVEGKAAAALETVIAESQAARAAGL
ncbi:anthranilate phosphoribosyltransferase [Aquihabitans sp. G128]|uniref:anthranilate phosphoribosyltransferase n=1 Tax=Aquihabitans sp. G128 TaxID=2849779 RepID=UPI001C22E18A|nr:anthranilate phosphoribosyltransferase [Aquihabitans sp. G128]QXC62326.1 anthranilate phosphoribosyltransferase [Aquihabitans sp. G128]